MSLKNIRVIYQDEAGSTSVLVPAPNCGLTIEEIIKKDIPEGANYEVVSKEDIPSDRTFRNQWCIKEKKIDVDIAKAKEHVHNKRREKRREEFKPLDEAIVADIISNPTAAKASEDARKAVRDKYEVVQTNIDSASSAYELKSILVNELS